MFTDRNEFTEEELRANVRVPKNVEEKLRTIVEKCLERSGIYHQVISRIKTPESLEKKYKKKRYDENKKIQDLVGIRINVYFEDDLRICRNIMEMLFGEAEWSVTEISNEEFRPQKINGVFRLPEDLKNMISDETWNYFIDDTFELQLKTIFFEGWHEIEHDMKYKGTDLWVGKSDRARYFNTILATLELCDKSIVTLFDNLGHDLYHERNYPGMIKAHFRLKMIDEELIPEIQEMFDQDTSVDNLPKRIFKTKREDLVYALLETPGKFDININTIIAVLNRKLIHDPRITTIMNDNDVFGRNGRSADDEMRYDLRLPEFMTTFHSEVDLDTTAEDKAERFTNIVKIIYSWFYNKYSGVLTYMSEQPDNVDIEEMGFRIKASYDEEGRFFVCEAKSIDSKEPGRLWVTQAILMDNGTERLHLSVNNGFTYYPNKNDKSDVTGMFSCPRFYRQIANQVGIIDYWKCGSTHCITTNEQAEEIYKLLVSNERRFPLVMVVSKDITEDGRLDESWLGSFALRYVQEKAGHYTHFCRIHLEQSEHLLKMIKDNNVSYEVDDADSCAQGVLIIRPKEKGKICCEWFSEDHIKNCKFASFDAIEHLMPFKQHDAGKAFGNELLQTLRRMNNDVDIYEVLK